MIQNYNIPVKKGTIKKEEYLHLSDDSQLKDVLYNKSIEKAKVLSFKNSNIKDETFRLLWEIKHPLNILQLDVSQNFSFVTDNAVQLITQMICFKNLKVINLADNQITDRGVQLLTQAPEMHRLQEIILYGNTDVTGKALSFLAKSNFLKHIKILDLHATSVDDGGMHQLMKSENSQDLQKLNLNMSWKSITNKSLSSIAYSKYCKNLKQLLLEDCRVGDQGIDELSQSQNLSHLIHLNLNNSLKQNNNSITDKSLASIALSKYITNLKTLQLRHTDITPKGVRNLAVSVSSTSLEMLRISHCKGLDSDVFASIQKIAQNQSFKKVYLNSCNIPKQDFQAFEHKNPKLNLIY